MYDRDSSLGKRRSPSYDRDEPREFRRSPSFDRDDPHDYRRDSAYDREERHHSQSRGSGRGSSHERGDSRTIKNPDSYDRPSSKEQRTPGIQDRRLSCPTSSDGARNAIGDRERSRDDPETALNGRGKGLLTDTDGSDPRNSKETVRADGEKRSGEERSKFASSSGGGNRSGRTSPQNDTLPSREKSGPDRDRRAPDFSKPEHDMSGRYSAQPLKLRSQAIPLRPKDGSTRDDKKRRFDSEGDNDRRTAGAAPASNPALTSRTNKGSVRYETGNGDSQRRRLLEGRDIGFKGKDVDKEHSVGGYRRGDARNDDTRWRASSVDGSLRRESQYYENAGPRSGQAAVSREHGDAGANKHSGTNPRGNTNTFNPEDYPMVSREYLNAPMSVSEWRELRHFLLTSGSDIDKLAFKLLQEITLSPLVGMSEKSLQPLSNAMMDVNKHYVTPHGIFTKLNDYPMGIQRLDPRYNSTDEADIDWADYQSSEYLALCQFLDNFQYAFNNHENPTKGNKFSRYEIPFRGSFGVKTQRKGPGVLLDGQAPPLYDDAVAADPLFEKFIQHYENFDMRKRSGTM